MKSLALLIVLIAIVQISLAMPVFDKRADGQLARKVLAKRDEDGDGDTNGTPLVIELFDQINGKCPEATLAEITIFSKLNCKKKRSLQAFRNIATGLSGLLGY